MRAGGRFAFWVALLALAPAGCRNTDLVETELRTRDQQYRQALDDLGKLESYNDALQRELAALRQGHAPLPEHAAPTFGLKRIALGRGTGGYDNDGLPGDEALQLIVEPRDGDDHTVKAPGTLIVNVLTVTPQGLKKPLCWWRFGPEQLRTSWKQGLLSTGYTLMLPWTVFPATESVRVVVQFRTADGRVFEADKDLKVRVVPGAPRLHDGPPLLPPPTPLPAGPVPSEPFPVPVFPPPVQETITRWAPAPLRQAVGIGAPEPQGASPPPVFP